MVKGSEASVRPDSVGVEFDDGRLIANAGLLLLASLSGRLGLEQLVREWSISGSAPAPPAPGARC